MGTTVVMSHNNESCIYIILSHTTPFTCLWCTCTYYACMGRAVLSGRVPTSAYIYEATTPRCGMEIRLRGSLASQTNFRRGRICDRFPETIGFSYAPASPAQRWRSRRRLPLDRKNLQIKVTMRLLINSHSLWFIQCTLTQPDRSRKRSSYV